MKPALLALSCCLLVVSAWQANAQSDPRETLRQVQLLIDKPDRLSPAEQAARASAALAALRAAPALTDQTWLTEPLAATPPDLVRANVRVTAALAALADRPRQPANPAARAALAAVLAEPRFHPTDLLSVLPAWLTPVALAILAAANVVGSVLQRLLNLLLTPLFLALRSPVFGPAMVVLAGVVIAAVFLLFRRGLRAALVAQAEVAPAAGEVPPTAADAVASARALAAQGGYRDACHYLLFTVLLRLEEQQGVHFDRAATNREHIRRLTLAAAGPRSDLVGAVDPVVQRFDRLWYGQATVTSDDYAELAALADRVREVAP